MFFRNFAPIVFLLLSAVLMTACGPSSTAEDSASTSPAAEGVAPEILQVADAWLALVDADDFDGSWEATGRLFREEVGAREWRESMTEVRGNMGAVTERRLHDQTLETIMPGVPEGRYMMLEYRSVFEKQARGAELVVLMETDEGEWRVIGYFLQ